MHADINIGRTVGVYSLTDRGNYAVQRPISNYSPDVIFLSGIFVSSPDHLFGTFTITSSYVITY